jgi:hypothetical protein
VRSRTGLESRASGRSRVLCLFVLGMSSVKDELKARLSEVRAGRRLDAGLVLVLANYLVDVAKVGDVSTVDLADLPETAEEAWQQAHTSEAPPVVLRQVKAWVAGKPGFSLRGSLGAPPSARSVCSADEEDLEENEEVLFGAGATGRDYERLEKDKMEQGISGARILRLSLGIELGRMCSTGEVVGSYTYRSDARLSALAKAQRKAGMSTLSRILDAKSDSATTRRDLDAHFGSLVREFSEDGLIQESSLLTQFWSETQSACSDGAGLKEYLTEWLRKYPGRGIPTSLDVVLATRVKAGQSTGGPSASEFKELRDLVKTLKSQQAELKNVTASLKTKVASLSNKKKPSPAGQDGKDKRRCFLCNESGHVAKDCPNKDEDEADDADGE